MKKKILVILEISNIFPKIKTVFFYLVFFFARKKKIKKKKKAIKMNETPKNMLYVEKRESEPA